jgi:hypothetical protein
MPAQIYGNDAMTSRYERVDLPDPIVRVTAPSVDEHDRRLAVTVIGAEQPHIAQVDKWQPPPTVSGDERPTST